MWWFSHREEEPMCAGGPAERLCEACCVRNICEWSENNLAQMNSEQKNENIVDSYVKNNEVKPN